MTCQSRHGDPPYQDLGDADFRDHRGWGFQPQSSCVSWLGLPATVLTSSCRAKSCDFGYEHVSWLGLPATVLPRFVAGASSHSPPAFRGWGFQPQSSPHRAGQSLATSATSMFRGWGFQPQSSRVSWLGLPATVLPRLHVIHGRNHSRPRHHNQSSLESVLGTQVALNSYAGSGGLLTAAGRPAAQGSWDIPRAEPPF